MYDKLQEKFDQACKDNNLLMVKYLLEKPSFKKHIDTIKNISINIEMAFNKNNLELVDCFFNQPEITDEIKTKTINDTFCNACFRDKLKLVKKIFYNDKYNSYISLEYNSSWCFRTAFSNQRKNILNFLIVDAKISQTDEWVQREMYDIYPQKTELMKFCESLFAYTKLSDKLPETVKPDPIKQKI